MMQDLTKITTPFGLLDEETQRALKECGGPWELWAGSRWHAPQNVGQFDNWYTYRKKPTPREYVAWLVCLPDGSMWGTFYTEDNVERVAQDIGGFVVKLTGVRDEG